MMLALGCIMPVDWIWEMWLSVCSRASKHLRIAQCLILIALKARGSTTQPRDENTETNREPTLPLPSARRSVCGR